MKLRYVVLILAVLAGVMSVKAGSAEIARHEINGRAIIIDSDGTWKYAEAGVAPTGECADGKIITSKKINLSMCIDPAWRIDNKTSGNFEFQFYDSSSEIYGALIAERTGVPIEALEYAILFHAANAMGVRNEDVPILKKSKVTLNGVEWNYIEYDIKLQGANFRFGNYYISLGEAGVAQLPFWCGRAYFEKNRKQIEKIASTVKVSPKPLE